ncbi:MAG: DUF4859 domain-containing protein [Bacteroidaceae bacterium]|nr:DUF4859 domain-containing protein [Bacteroidaceae bacterium]
MKHRLLTASLMLAATLAAWAQNWTAPVYPYSSSGVDPTDGGTYYIRNVGCGQFITGANSWATQISVTTDKTPYLGVAAEAVYGESSSEYTDVTSTYISDADFANLTPLDSGVCTYANDIEINQDNGAKYSGMQNISGWTSSIPGVDGAASGLFAVGSASKIWLGSPKYTVPSEKADGSVSGNLMGIVSTWGSQANYTKEVTLPAGTYSMTIPIYNSGGSGAVSKNKFGFIANGGQEYLGKTLSFSIGEWMEEKVTFTLENETSGVISLGYDAANAGSGSMPHLWIGGVKLEKATAENQQQLLGYKLKLYGTFYFTGDHNRVNFAVSNTYLFRDSEASGFVDLGGQSRNAIWVLTKDDNGYYRIQSTTENGEFPNAATQYAYAKDAGQAVVFNMTEASAGSDNLAYLEWEFISTDVSQEDIALYAARIFLYDALLVAYEAGVDYQVASGVYESSSDVSEISEATKLLEARTNLYQWIQKANTYEIDTSDALSVYQSSNDVTTINAAADALKSSVNYAMMLAEIPNSTLENPLDITDFVLKNANFDEGNTNGWEVTQTMGQNLGYQLASYVNGNVTISKFIEAWIPTPATLKDGVIAQTYSGLPEGHYRLECDGIAVCQNDESLEVTGVYLFYDNGSIIYKSPSSLNTGNGAPEHLTFEFDYDGASEMKIGLMTSSTNANWLAADNFKLYAIGPMLVPPSYTALQNALPAYESMSLDEIAYTDDVTRFSTAISDARKLVDAGSDPTLKDTYTQAAQELEAAAAAYRSSVAAYVTFRQFIDEKKNLYFDSDAINNAVSTQVATYESAYSARSYSTEQIQQSINDFEGIILHAALAARENTVFQSDLTDYLSNMSFANSIDQERYPNTSAEWQNETETTAYCTAYTTAEVWNQPRFNIFREISNMPAGKYVITVQGVYRETANVYNYNNFLNGDISGQAFFYANDQKANLANLASFAATDANSGWANVAINNEGNTVYVINSQSAANLLFNGEYKPETKQATQLRLTVNVAEGETLRFGIKGEELLDNAWVVWSDFRIYAAGTDSPENVTPETSLSNINIVATKEITVKQHPRTDYSSNTVLVDITDYEAMVGYPIDYVKNNLAASLFCGTFVSSESQIKGDVLSNTQTASQLGWWLGSCQNELNEETGEVVIAQYGDACKYFAEAYSIIEKDEQQPDGTTQKHYYLSCNIGQYPNALTVGQNYYHTAYIIFGNKAYAVKYTLNITDPSTTNFNELEIVGNTSVTMDQGPGYETGEFHLDVDAIASLLDCDVSELKVQYWKDSEYTLLTTNRSAKNDGAWLNADGTLGAFESAPVYVENPTANDYSVFASGNYENLVEVGQTYQVAFFLTNSELTKGYRVNVNINIVEKDYAKALAYIKNSESYRIYATLSDSNSKYYLTTNGILTDNKEDASLFTFTSVEANGTLYRIGWDLGCAFTNPTLTNGSNGDIVNNGNLNTNIDNNRNDWERQVFFYNDEAFAVRATNANSANWGASTYWTIIDTGALPEAGYSLDAAYVWHLEKDGENEYIDRDETVAGITGAEGGLDVTQWIVNPTPTSSYEGWDWSDTPTFDEGNNNAEYWMSSGAAFSQTIPYLPAGYYILTAQAFTRTNMTAYLSMTVGEEENKVELATVAKAVVDNRAQANTWFNEGNGINEVRFQVPTSGEATIKLTADNTTGDYWLVWRSFTLRYVGTEGYDAFDQTLCPALLAEITQKATDASGLLEQKMDAEVKTALEGLITDAGDLANESYNVLVAFKKALLAGIQNANNSISYYKTLVPYITEAEEIVAKLDKFAAAKEAVAAHLNDMTTAYNNGTATAELVETWMGKTTALARENMDWTKVDEGTDISFLIQNPHFKFGQYGPYDGQSYYGNEESTPGWTLNSGAIKELRPATHNIEAWHQAFDLSQTLPNMPAGVYDLTLQGFVRHDDVQITDQTYLYAGVSTRAIMQCTDQWRTEPIYYEGVEMLGDDHYDVEHQQEEGPSHWVDNGMTGSYYWFQTVNPNATEQGGQEGDCYYTNHLKVVLAQNGNFTIGLHCNINTDWVIWDNFQLKYLGNPASLYTETIYEKLDSLKDEIAACQMPTTATGQLLYNAMSEKADNAVATGQEAPCQQIIADLDTAITDVIRTEEWATTLSAKTSSISQSIAGKHSSDRTINSVITLANKYINKQAVFADSTEIKTLCAQLDDAYEAFVAGEFDPAQIQTLIASLRQSQDEQVLSDEIYLGINDEIAYIPADLSESTDEELVGYIAKLDSVSNVVVAYQATLESLLTELPVGKDLTALLMNPSYTLGEVGWVADNMHQMGSATMGCVITTTHESDGVTLSTFAESWNGGNVVADASIRQTTRMEIPAGTYALDADIITSTAEGLVENVFMFIEIVNGQSGQKEMVKQTLRVNGGQPGHSQMIFNHSGGKLTFGICFENTNATWVGMDNWKLTVSTAPDATDIAIIKEAFEQMGGSQGNVLGWNPDTNPTGLVGVTYTEGHVSEIDLSGYGLDGSFPSALLKLSKLTKLNLAGNALQGSLTEPLTALVEAKQTSPLQSLNITGNKLQGNIGLIGKICPSLTSLNAASNQLSDCTPAMPATVTTLDLQNQAIAEVWTLELNEKGKMYSDIPAIQTYGDANVYIDYGIEGNIFKKENGCEITATTTEGVAKGSSSKAIFNFLPGDVDFSAGIDVVDLQGSINYIFSQWDSEKMFNFTAANMYADEQINVQDIVKHVDVILAQNDNTSDVKEFRQFRSRALINNDEEPETEPEAYIFWRENELVLQSRTAVSAADICVSNATDIQWGLTQMGFTVSQKQSAARSRAVAYSLSGVEIPAGESVIATKRGGSSEVVAATLSDSKARRILTDIQTPLPTGIEELAAAEGGWTLVATNGSIIAKGEGVDAWRSARRRLASGVYILSNANNQTQKVTIK